MLLFVGGSGWEMLYVLDDYEQHRRNPDKRQLLPYLSSLEAGKVLTDLRPSFSENDADHVQ